MPDSPLAPGSLTGRVALITGSSRGIGAQTARLLSAAGAAVVINYRNKAARAQALADELTAAGGQVLVIGADLTDPDSVQAMVDQTTDRFGGIDLLVLNASGGMEADMPADYALRLNRDAQLGMLRTALPAMGAGSRVVFITSHQAHFIATTPTLPQYRPVAESKRAGEDALLAELPTLTAAGVEFVVVSGDMIEGTITATLLERAHPGALAERRDSAGALLDVASFAAEVAAACVAPIPGDHTRLIGDISAFLADRVQTTELTSDHLAQLATTKFGWKGPEQAAAIGADYARRVAACLATWQLTAEGVLDSGMGLPVLRVRDRDGELAVLKLGWEDGFSHQVRTLQAAEGRGYARVLGWDGDQQAVLLEHLGPALFDQGLTPEQQLEQQVATLELVWQVQVELPDEPAWLRQDKAVGLRGILAEHGPLAPEFTHVIEHVDRLAQTLTERGRHPVLVHGDAHTQNLLLREGGEWVFIDPDGFACDAGYDLGVTLRHFSGELLALEREQGPDAVAAQLHAWADLLSARTGVAADLIFDWALLERVTTGLYLLHLELPDEGNDLLHLADLIVRAEGSPA